MDATNTYSKPIQKIDHSSGRTGLCDCIVYIHEKKCVLAHVVVVVVAKFKAACCEFRAAGDREMRFNNQFCSVILIGVLLDFLLFYRIAAHRIRVSAS